MKNIIKASIAGIATFIVIYLIGSFVQVSFDIKQWTELARIIVGLYGGIQSIIIFCGVLCALEGY